MFYEKKNSTFLPFYKNLIFVKVSSRLRLKIRRIFSYSRENSRNHFDVSKIFEFLLGANE